MQGCIGFGFADVNTEADFDLAFRVHGNKMTAGAKPRWVFEL
ncbi:hypothetical protein ADIMK_0153 [Marinobacterium lacunae]|uniref:Uncharacterized protein n=1 Tax=Marinobacterium lacunae TaxID=1232683 RepID=A0A081G4C6_9GAMM|nr:hypothetical protein ADIMK_0153 [Marinobacterium lacunae]